MKNKLLIFSFTLFSQSILFAEGLNFVNVRAFESPRDAQKSTDAKSSDEVLEFNDGFFPVSMVIFVKSAKVVADADLQIRILYTLDGKQWTEVADLKQLVKTNLAAGINKVIVPPIAINEVAAKFPKASAFKFSVSLPSGATSISTDKILKVITE